MRIGKFIALSGTSSRRGAEALVRDGRISVNGSVVSECSFKVGEGDEVFLDGRLLRLRKGEPRLWSFYKPKGCIVSEGDPRERRTVFEIIDGLGLSLPRLIAVGRLDYNSEGLLLLSDDGGLARMLELPSTGLLRHYRVRVFGRPKDADLARLSAGVTIDGVDYRGIEVKIERQKGSNCWLTMVLSEGKNREIRKVMSYMGFEVNRLIRVGYGDFTLGDLKPCELSEVSHEVLSKALLAIPSG